MRKLALVAMFLFAAAAMAQVAVAPYRNARATFTDNNGNPLASGCVFFFAGGTTTPQATYTDYTGTILNSNPVILDSTGSANIWLGPQTYKISAWSVGGTNCASGVQLWTVDQVPGNYINGAVFNNITMNGLTLTGLLTATSANFSGAVTTGSLNNVTTIQPGATITTSTVAAACNGSTPGMVLLPPGTVNVASLVTVPSNCVIAGAGPNDSILSCSNASPIAACLDFNAVSNSALTGFELLCAQSPATCTTGIRARLSQHLKFTRMVISGGGYGAGSNPLAQVWTENDDDVLADDVRFTNSGGKYEWVNGYQGNPSTRIQLRRIVDDNNVAIIALTMFNCQYCSITDSYVNENNQTDSTTQDGYAFLYYATNTTIALTSGCTGSGTLICTIPLLSSTTQLPIGTNFRVLIGGVTGGTGTINGTWDATLTSPTTFTVTGAGNTAGASFASAYIFYPSTNNILANDHAANCAGTCFYLQGSEYSTITNWIADNCAIQEVGSALPTGCVAVNGGNPIVSSAATYANHGSTVGPGVANGSGQYCLDVADTVDFVSHGWSCNNAAIAGVRLFGGSLFNLNFDIGDVTIDNVPICVKSNAASTNTGNIGGTCQNFTSTGLQPSSGGITFRNWKLTVGSYLPCIDDFFAGNVFTEVSCTGGYDLFAGSNTKATNLRVLNTTAGATNHAIQISGATHLTMINPVVDTANDGIFFSSGAQQASDVTIEHPRLVNITAQPALWDTAPASVTLTTNSNTSATLTTSATVTAGMGIGDYGAGGNNDLPFGTTITNTPGSCVSGCAITLSQAATGSHASETALLQNVMSSNVNITDLEAEGNTASCPTTSQVVLLYGMQGLNLGVKSISCFGTNAAMDFRGQSGQVTKNRVTGGVVTGGTGTLAAFYIGGGATGSAGGTTVDNLTCAGTLTNCFYDHGTATGNVFNGYTNTLGGFTNSITNTNTTVLGGTSNVWYLNATACTPTTSTDAQCSASQTVAQADASYSAQITMTSSAGANLLATITGKTSTTLSYVVTCTFNCGSYGTLTADIYVHHN